MLVGVSTSALLVLAGLARAQDFPIPQNYVDNGVTAGMLCGTGVISYCDPNSTEGKGILAEVNQAWAKEMGLNIRIEGMTWEALMPAAVSGRTDMVAGIGDIESRRAQFNFVDVFYGFYGMLVPAGNPKGVSGWGDLCGLTLSTSSGSGEQMQIQRMSDEACVAKGLEPIKIDVYGEQAATFVALQSGRVDATLTDMFGANQLIEQNPQIYAEAFRERGQTIWGIAVPVDDPDLLAVVTEGVRRGLKSGSIKGVLDNYGVGDIIVEGLMVNSKPVE
jgi:polar amino acid transport system substrate-binding protein